MSPFIFYKPFYYQLENSSNDSSLSEKDHKAGCDVSASSPSLRSLRPRLDLHEDTEKNIVTASYEFPGFSKDEVQIDFQDGKLTVSAETKKSEQHGDADTGYTIKERHHGKFSSTLQLPQGVQSDQIKATMDNGLLTVTFPKSMPEFPAKKIVIQNSSG